MLGEIQVVGKQNRLQGIEMIQDVVLSEEEWTPQSGLVTSSQKVIRRVMLERYKGEIESVYATSS